MIAFKIQVITVIAVIIVNVSIVNGWFERSNYRVDLESNAVFPLKSLPYQRGSSTRVVFVGQSGANLTLICNINFSKGCRRCDFFGDTTITRRGSCCDDYFYVGYNLDPNIQGAERFCGVKTIQKNSRQTSGRPVLVIATSATRNGRYGKYKCYISSTGNSSTTSSTAASTAASTTP
ncbi:uncharacterized protein LOC129577112 [Sitodiplosis mosellana]|uniref:uncharacterized protein LOC129577112 n=1 Tax=Sitodiplosis mosellana TaxID=263140 RepID=UPI0024448E7E|nr:uncharacterized protein LOC129577112 [Sitodiplosis mosellana]